MATENLTVNVHVESHPSVSDVRFKVCGSLAQHARSAGSWDMAPSGSSSAGLNSRAVARGGDRRSRIGVRVGWRQAQPDRGECRVATGAAR